MLCVRIVIVLLHALVLIIVPLARIHHRDGVLAVLRGGGRVVDLVVLLLLMSARATPARGARRLCVLGASTARVAAHHQLRATSLRWLGVVSVRTLLFRSVA